MSKIQKFLIKRDLFFADEELVPPARRWRDDWEDDPVDPDHEAQAADQEVSDTMVASMAGMPLYAATPRGPRRPDAPLPSIPELEEVEVDIHEEDQFMDVELA